MSVYGADVSMAEEPYFAIAAFEETPEPEPPQVAAGGGAQDDGTGLLIILVVAAIFGIGIVFALTLRSKNDDGGDKNIRILKS
jgi:hypothetical protein